MGCGRTTERRRASDWTGTATRIPGATRILARARPLANALPRGRLLPDSHWSRRHRWIVHLLTLHAVGLTLFALIQGFGLAHSLVEGGAIAVAAFLARSPRLSRSVRSVAASLGLVTSSALVVHISGGAIEAHFHFFFVLGVLTLYQDWLPYLLAIAYVVLHHGVLGAIEPTSVYNHPAAIANPWRWALIHAAFVVATSAASIVSWRVNEQLLREPLTGLPGRTVFLHRASRALEKARGAGTNVAVLYLDLDRFKTLNDSVGHLAGDRLLVAAAARIEEASRNQDVVARIGGDEFAILCEGVAGPEEASGIADRIIAALDEPLDIDGMRVAPSASVGVALTDPGVSTPEELIGRADLAMYRAKETGERCVVFSEGMREEERRAVELEAELRLAVERRELRLLYQPIVSLVDGQVVGVEALLRWQHPTRGLLAPSEFIPVAERSGAIVPIGEWVLREACRDAAGWTSTMYVSVNLSPRQFACTDLVESVAAVLEETGVAPHRLAVEITEGLLLDDSDQAVQTLRDLASLGITIVIDDFGSGPASLGYLSRFPIGFLKLDRSILARLEDEPERSEAILGAIAGMAKALGMTIVAGGVESERQLRTLRLLGWRFAQGFHLGGPQPAEAISELLSGRPAAAAG